MHLRVPTVPPPLTLRGPARSACSKAAGRPRQDGLNSAIRPSRTSSGFHALMLDGPYSATAFNGRLYLNPHQLFRTRPTIWRVAAQDLIDNPACRAPRPDGGRLGTRHWRCAAGTHGCGACSTSRRAITGTPTMFAPSGDTYRRAWPEPVLPASQSRGTRADR